MDINLQQEAGFLSSYSNEINQTDLTINQMEMSIAQAEERKAALSEALASLPTSAPSSGDDDDGSAQRALQAQRETLERQIRDCEVSIQYYQGQLGQAQQAKSQFQAAINARAQSYQQWEREYAKRQRITAQAEKKFGSINGFGQSAAKAGEQLSNTRANYYGDMQRAVGELQNAANQAFQGRYNGGANFNVGDRGTLTDAGSSSAQEKKASGSEFSMDEDYSWVTKESGQEKPAKKANKDYSEGYVETDARVLMLMELLKQDYGKDLSEEDKAAYIEDYHVGRSMRGGSTRSGSTRSGSGSRRNSHYGEDRPKTYHITKEEQMMRWKSTVQNVDELMNNWRTELRAKGVPDGEWMERTLASHRARILETESYDLEVARGNGHNVAPPTNRYRYPSDYDKFYDDLAAQYRATL